MSTAKEISEESGDRLLPAELDEQQEAIVQTSKLREMTVRPGLMKVPVADVGTAANSEQWYLDMDHPVEDNIRFFLEKPIHGWTEDYQLVQLLHWYGIVNKDADYGAADPYALELYELYIEWDEDEGKWELAEPPTDPGLLERSASRVRNAISPAFRVDRTLLTMFGFIMAGIIAGSIASSIFVTLSTVASIILGIAVPIFAILLGMVVTEP